MGQKSSSQRRDRLAQTSVMRYSTPATVAQYHPPPPEQNPAVTNDIVPSPAINPPFDIYLNNRQDPFDRNDSSGLFAPTQHNFVIETFRGSPIISEAVGVVHHHANPEPIAHESIKLLKEGVTMIRNCDPSFVFLKEAEAIMRVVDKMVPKAEQLFELSESRRMSFAWIATVAFWTAEFLCGAYEFQHSSQPGLLEYDQFTPESIQKLIKSGFAPFARSGVYDDELVDDEKKTGESRNKRRKAVGKRMLADKKIMVKAFPAFVVRLKPPFPGTEYLREATRKQMCQRPSIY
ncbi:hypothetical protein L198_01277 [Cryptococcus wingfieldii CBS 7118]|uniref:Uncharacterized protein n=1 Tax=Cryptococcus wingfieldii CBS 7118 TaxID=1295528 RepID=A0A1E3JYV1_9TREE|nr:hypothetical protein L198_01277 [Cryptococcus wingfieldii CBS 7118]ODO06048.1 hypothetical protein L198_01277 [Cryptococcus wingfieldii CBS 7118]